MDTQNIAITRAITLLKAAGAQFFIIGADGEQYGELPKPKITRQKSGIDFKAIYYPVIGEMQPGDVCSVRAPEGISTEKLRGAMSGFASQNWGNGNHISSIKGDVVEILRVA